MDDSVIFAFWTLLAILFFGLGMVVGSLIAAIWLRLAATWLRLGTIPYGLAVKAVLLSSFVVLAIQLSISANYGLALAPMWEELSMEPYRSSNLFFRFGPTHFLYAAVLNLLVMAALFRCLLPDKDGTSRMAFGDCFALASLYYAISFAVVFLLGLLAYVLAGGLLTVAG